MSVQKLQQLAELDEERNDLLKRLAGIEQSMAHVIGDGFEVAGIKVRPKKKYKGASPPAADGQTAPSTGNAPAAKETIAKVLACVESKRQEWSAPSIAAQLRIDIGPAGSSLYWLAKQGKIKRVARGLYCATVMDAA